LVIRRGTKRAIIALAHKVLKAVFVLLSRQVPYRDSTVDYQAFVVKRNAPRWQAAEKIRLPAQNRLISPRRGSQKNVALAAPGTF
jgi:hypothetical protein